MVIRPGLLHHALGHDRNGGGSDVFSRMFARYLTRYLPGNPAIAVQNLPAAGGVVAAQELFNTAARDGTVFASVMRTVPFMPLLTDQRVIAVEQIGLFSQSVAEFELSRIQDVIVDVSGILSTMMNFGTIKISTAGEHPDFEFR